jgi:hypothetical protein
MMTAQFVFIGRLTRADLGWHNCTGAIVVSRAELRFRVLRSLKGDIRGSDVAVFHIMLGDAPYFDVGEAKGRRLRLSPSFFRRGREYIVIASRYDPALGDGAQLYVAGEPYGIWPANPGNLAAVDAGIEAAHPPANGP